MQIKFIDRDLKFIPLEEFKEFYEKAEKLSPDIKDVPYLALALKLNSAIWSNDKRLKNQSKINIISTENMLKFFEESK
jgi:predicted nucleic acid-binding protein